MEATRKTANADRATRAAGARATKAEAGFTLVEAMSAIVILAFGIMAIANLMVVAASSNSVANQGTGATTLASQQLEVLKAIPFTDPGTSNFNAGLTPGGDLDADVAGYFTNPPAEVPGVGQVRVRWRITAIPDVLNAALIRGVFIEVRAEGTGALTGARSRAEFTTFRSCTDSDPNGLNCP